MLGAALAFHRDEHMRMTAFAAGLGAKARALLDRFALGAAIAFLALALKPAIDFAVDDMDVTTPALELSSAWRSMALPIGLALMLVMALLRLAALPDRRASALGIGAVAVCAAAFYLAAPQFAALGNLNLIVFFVALVAALVFAATPIAFAFALSTFGYIVLTTSTPPPSSSDGWTRA